ncbi:MAG TPA: TIM-barrel domain-containing protein [Terracidiphilus sp.]|nr:TIM-barrel domain-containing protein [Terracidiphilus sp.]
MQLSLHPFAAITLVAGWTIGVMAQQLKPVASAGPGEAPIVAGDSASPSSIHSQEQPVDNPVADPRAVVTLSKARFTMLTPQLIRMEWSADSKFEDHASLVFINRRMPVPKFTSRIEYAGKTPSLEIQTDALRLTYSPSGDGRFTADNLSIALEVDGKPVTWKPGAHDAQNLLGTTRTLDGALGDKTKEPIGNGFVSRSGWAVEDDSTRPLFDSADFRFLEGENSPWPWVMERPAGDRQDWYFFGYGHDYKKALGDYVRVAGRIPLPPRFAFGAWWSRYWAYSDQEIEEIIRGFRENDTPLDVFVIDMDWHINREQLEAMGEKDQAGQSLGWTGYTWNKLLFPDPVQFLTHLHADGLKTSLNMHPASGVQPWEEAYPAMARAMGIDPATKKYVPFDITDKKYATNYMNLLHHPLEKQGIDFWWLDWQQESTTKLPGVNPTWWLNYVHFTDEQREGKRPLLFHRWGGLGNHRYQIGFSGDTISVWDSLAFQPWFTATAANVGYAYWSHDIGGHMPGAVDPELYTRWVQFGAFSPILRTHTTKNPDSERRIWAYPEPYSSILRSAFQMRYALQPYLYTEARRTYDTGVAFFRALYYDWPEANEAYTSKNEYLFGDQMLVAPVVAPAEKISGLASERVWLPEGEWIEWPTGKHFIGPARLDRNFSIDQTPVYLKAGAIVPMQPPTLHTSEKPVDPLIVNIWPLKPGTSSSYSVYEDSGVSVDYQRGVFARTPIQAKQTGDLLTVEIGPVEGSYPGMLKTRGYELRLSADWPPESVVVNGSPLKQGTAGVRSGWSFEGNTLTTIIPIPSISRASRVAIEVRRAQGLTNRRDDLDGFAGAMTRLRGAYDALQKTWPIAQPPDPLIDAMQTGDRLSYHPERAKEEIGHFHEVILDAQTAVDGVQQGFAERVDEFVKRMGQSALRNVDIGSEKQSRLDALARAQRLLADAH